MLESLTVGEIVGAISVIGVLIAGAGYITKPIKDYNEKYKEMQDEIKNIKLHQDNDNKRLATLESDSKMTLRVLNAILGHLQTGNNSGEMKDAKQALEKYIIERWTKKKRPSRRGSFILLNIKSRLAVTTFYRKTFDKMTHELISIYI